MSRRWFGLAGLLVVPGLLVAACSDDERAPGSVFNPPGGAGGEAGTGEDAGLDADLDGMGGAGGLPEGGGGTGVCPTVSPDPFCQNCVENLCTDPCNTCRANAACLELLTCVNACPDISCMGGCEGQHPGGSADLTALLGGEGCMATQCGLSCQGGGDGGAECGIIYPGACGDCVNQKCLNECNACFTNIECRLYFACSEQCAGNAQCIQDCTTTYPGGVSPSEALLGPTGCIATQCQAECP